jgi:hypothetical protein
MQWILAQIPGGPPGAQNQGPPPLPFPDIEPPLPVQASLEWWWIALATLLVLLLCLWLWRMLTAPKLAQALAPRRPLQSALRKLREVRAKVDSTPPATTGHEVSEVLREYYLHRYSVPAPFRTTQELFPTGWDEPETSRRKKWRERFAPLAPEYDRLAYAPVPATTEDARQLVESAIVTLEAEVSQAEEAVV